MATTAELELRVESKDVSRAAKANEGLAASGKKVAKSSTDAAKAENQQAGASKKVAKEGNKAADSNRRQTKTADRLKEQYGGLQKQILAVGAAFLTFQGARQALSIIADFGEATAIVRALAGATDKTGESFARLEAQSRQLGATTRFTATQAAQAQAALLRGGLDTAEALKATASTLDLAIAGMLSLERAAEITAITLNQFNLSASQSTRVADVLVQASNTSATSVEQLAEALKFAAPVAAGFGASLEETSAALQVLANAGLQASLGGTNLRGAYAALASPTSRATREISKLAKASGQSADAFDITKRSLGEVFQAFQDANAGPVELLKIFGRLQAPGAIALTAAGNEIDKFAKNLEDSEGAAASFREELQKELKDQLLSLVSAVQELVLVFNDQFGPAIISTVQFLTQVVRVLQDSNQEMDKFSPAARLAAKVLKLLAVAAAAFVAVKLFTAIGAASQAMFAFITTLKILRATLITTGIGALIVGLGVLAGFALEASGAFETMGENVDDVKDATEGLAAAGLEAEKSARQLANQTSIETKEKLRLAQIEIDKEDALARRRKEAGKVAARQAKQRRTEAEAAKQTLRSQDLSIQERIDTAGLNRDAVALRKAGDAFERLFATANQLTLDPGQSVFEAIALDVKDGTKQMELMIKAGEGLTARLTKIAEAQKAEADALAATNAFAADLSIAEAFDDSLQALQNFNRTGLDRVLAETFGEFKDDLEAIREVFPELADAAEAAVRRMGQQRFALQLNEDLAQTVDLLGNLERSGERTAGSFDQFAESAAAAIAVLEKLNSLPGADIEANNKRIQAITASVEQFSAEVGRAQGFKQLEEGVKIVTRSFFDLFEALITGSATAAEAFAAFISSVTQALFQKFVVEQVINAISKGFAGFSGIASANGNVFDGGNVVPFAKGGIIGGPTVFPLGLAGEAGPEAILPLSRGPDGRLGVQVQGGQDRPGANPFVLRSMSPGASNAPTAQEVRGGSSRTVNIQQNIVTPDASSFRRSSRQLSDLALQSVRL